MCNIQELIKLINYIKPQTIDELNNLIKNIKVSDDIHTPINELNNLVKNIEISNDVHTPIKSLIEIIDDKNEIYDFFIYENKVTNDLDENYIIIKEIMKNINDILIHYFNLTIKHFINVIVNLQLKCKLKHNK